MPTYHYQCAECSDDWMLWQPMTSVPLTSHEGCDGRPLRVLGPVRTYSVGVHGVKTREVDATERTWDKDRPAYKRLRMNGMAPPHVDGAAKLETLATNDLEVNTGLRYGPINERATKEHITEARESGWLPAKA